MACAIFYFIPDLPIEEKQCFWKLLEIRQIIFRHYQKELKGQRGVISDTKCISLSTKSKKILINKVA